MIYIMQNDKLGFAILTYNTWEMGQHKPTTKKNMKLCNRQSTTQDFFNSPCRIRIDEQ